MFGSWAAVKATTREPGSSRKTMLKLWKSRPAAPMMMTRVTKDPPEGPAIIPEDGDRGRAAGRGRGTAHGRAEGAPAHRRRVLPGPRGAGPGPARRELGRGRAGARGRAGGRGGRGARGRVLHRKCAVRGRDALVDPARPGRGGDARRGRRPAPPRGPSP